MKSEYNSTSWIEYLKLIYQNILKIISISLVVGVLTAGLTLLIDDQYKSYANLLPNDKRNIGMGILQGQGAGGLGSIASSVLGGGQPEIISRFYVLLESQTTKNKIIKELGLIEHYNVGEVTHPLKTAREILSERSSFMGKEEGNFVIEIWDKDPEMAKKIADFYVQRLNHLNTEISTKEATEYRRFIEDRYKNSLQELDSLRREMTTFQENYGVYQLPQQVSSYFSLLASVSKKKIQSEIKLELLDKTVNKKSNTYQQALKQHEVVSNKLNDLYRDQGNENLILNFQNLPQIGSQYFDLMRRLEVQKEVQKTLVPLYEQAKMEEAKALPLVTVVDDPVIPKEEGYPPRALIVIMAAITTGILCISYYMIRLSLKKNRKYIDYIVQNE